MEEIKTKICSKCKIEKNINEYYKLQSWCKVCQSEYSKKYNELHRKEINERRRNYSKRPSVREKIYKNNKLYNEKK